jgi:hypothetical protein
MDACGADAFGSEVFSHFHNKRCMSSHLSASSDLSVTATSNPFINAICNAGPAMDLPLLNLIQTNVPWQWDIISQDFITL